MWEKSLKRIAASSGIGAAVGIMVSSVFITAMAAVLAIGDIPAVIISPLTVVVLALGSFCGGFISGKVSGEKGIFCGIAVGVIFFLTAWILGGIFENAGFGVAAIIKFIMIVLSSAIGGIIGVNYIKK